MFRRLESSLPKDPAPPSQLEELGYFVNADDHIRMIEHPEQKYQYAVNRSERVNDLVKEAMNACVRNIVHQRLSRMGFSTIRFPLGANATENHVPILVSPNISDKKRVVVYFGERNQDPTIFSYRATGDEGIAAGSILNFAHAVLNGPVATIEDEAPGLIVANPAQLLWYRGGQKAVSWTTWLGLPRESAVMEPFRVDPVTNTISGNHDFREHVSYMFDQFLKTKLQSDVKLDIIGVEYTGMAVLEYLTQNWSIWASRVNGICLCNPQHKIQDFIDDPNTPRSFISFIAKRCRAYFISNKSLEEALEGRNEFGCNCYASGEQFYQESVMVKGWRSAVDWFNLLSTSPTYEEPEHNGYEDSLPN